MEASYVSSPADVNLFQRYSHLIGFLRLLPFLLPSLAYLVTTNWDIVYRDCYPAVELSFDLISNIITFWLYLFGPERDDLKQIVMVLTLGIGFNTMSLAMYMMYRSVHDGKKITAGHWYFWLVGFVLFAAFLTMVGLNMKDDLAINKGLMTPMINNIWWSAILFELLKASWPVFLRLRSEKFYTPDGRKVFIVKQAGSALSALVMLLEYCDLSRGKEKNAGSTSKLRVISLVAGVLSAAQFLVRCYEPKRQLSVDEILELSENEKYKVLFARATYKGLVLSTDERRTVLAARNHSGQAASTSTAEGTTTESEFDDRVKEE